MFVYCTSKNTGPSWQSDPVHLMYIGTSLKEAEEIVGDFIRYARQEQDWPRDLSVCSALPRNMDREMLSYFMADGWWFSIEKFELKDK